MVGTIGFVGSKARERRTLKRWWSRIGGSYVVGSLLGGAALGGVTAFSGGVFEQLVGELDIAVVGGFLLPFAVADLLGISSKRMFRGRQAPLSWKHVFPPPLSAFLYGALLGVGVLTTVHFWSFIALMVAILLMGSIPIGLVAGVGFGLGRSIPILLSLLASDEHRLETVTMQVEGILARRRHILQILSAASVISVCVVLVSA